MKSNKKLGEVKLYEHMLSKFIEKGKEQQNTKKAIITSCYTYLLPELRKRYKIVTRVARKVTGNKNYNFTNIKLILSSEWKDCYHDDLEYAEGLLKDQFFEIDSELGCPLAEVRFGKRKIDIGYFFPKVWFDLPEKDFEEMLTKAWVSDKKKNPSKTMENILKKLNKKEIAWLTRNGATIQKI